MALDGSVFCGVRQRLDFELFLKNGEEATVVLGSLFLGAVILCVSGPHSYEDFAAFLSCRSPDGLRGVLQDGCRCYMGDVCGWY